MIPTLPQNMEIVVQQPPQEYFYNNSHLLVKDKNVADFCTFSFNNQSKNLINPFEEFFIPWLPKIVSNAPKVVKPHRQLDVTKNMYSGAPEFLDMFLGDGKLKGKGKEFIKAQKKYGINAIFLIAIADVESICGKSKLAKSNNNFGGMRGKNGWLKFNSIDEGIDELASNLKRCYTDDGLVTIDKIAKRYAESQTWAETVVSKMNNMYKYSQCKVFKF